MTSELPAQRKSLDIRCYLAEAIGTGILVLIGPGAVMVSAATHAFGHSSVALAFGLVITLLVAVFGTISGAHLNPAVTIAFWSVQRFPTRHAIPYVAAQCMGAVVAALALRWILGPVGNIGTTVPTLDWARSFVVEVVFSAILALVIFATATDKRVPAFIAPFLIGATVGVGALVAGPLTGGSFNPARSFGPAVAAGIWQSHWLYWIAPIAGMMTAARGYEFLRGAAPPEVDAPGAPLGVEGPMLAQQNDVK